MKICFLINAPLNSFFNDFTLKTNEKKLNVLRKYLHGIINPTNKALYQDRINNFKAYVKTAATNQTNEIETTYIKTFGNFPPRNLS